MNRKNLYRPYTEEKLGVRQRPGAWRMNANGRGANPSESWPLDFLSDTFSASRRLRILVVSDDCYPECLCLMADTSIPGARVARHLFACMANRPAFLVITTQGSPAGRS